MDTRYKQWLDELTSTYDVHLTNKEVGNQFVTEQLDVNDKGGRGLGFTLCFNSEGHPSLLMIEGLKLDRFNIAEGYTSEDILQVTEEVLRGRLKVSYSRFLKRAYVVFETSRGMIRAKVVNPRTIQAKPYKRLKS